MHRTAPPRQHEVCAVAGELVEGDPHWFAVGGGLCEPISEPGSRLYGDAEDEDLAGEVVGHHPGGLPALPAGGGAGRHTIGRFPEARAPSPRSTSPASGPFESAFVSPVSRAATDCSGSAAVTFGVRGTLVSAVSCTDEREQ